MWFRRGRLNLLYIGSSFENKKAIDDSMKEIDGFARVKELEFN
jgi:hypothetical protein